MPPAGVKATRNSSGVYLVRGDDGSFVSLYGNGVPTLTSFLGDNVPQGAIYVDTSSGIVYYYSGVTWTPGSSGGGGVTVGDAVTGGVADSVLYVDGAGNVGSEAALAYDDTTNTLSADAIIATNSLTDMGLTAGRVTFAGASGLLSDDADLTFATDTLTAAKLSTGQLTDSGLTSGRIPIAGVGGLIGDDADLTFSGGNTLNATNAVVSTGLTNSALTSGRVVVAGTAGLLGDDADLTFSGGNTLNATNAVVSTGLTNSALTSGRVVIAGTAGLLGDDADLTFATDTLTATKIIGTTTITPSNLSASQLVVSDASKALASNGTITSNAIPKSVSSGATLAASALSDDATSVTTSEPIIASAASKDLGSTAAPFRTLVWHGSGTFGTGDFTLAGTPTAHRTVTFVDADFTVAGRSLGNTFTALNSFTGGIQTVDTTGSSGLGLGTSGLVKLLYSTTQTPDAPLLATGTLSNSFGLIELADNAFDFNNGLAGTAAATDPAFVVHSHNQNTTEYNHLNFMGSHGGNLTTLTDNTATAFFHTPTVTAGQCYIGTGTYAVKVVDGSNETQVAAGTFEWYVMRGNTGGTVSGIQQTGNDGVLAGLPLKATSSGTLTVALTTTVTSNVATFFMTADTSLTPTVFTMSSQVDVRLGPAEVLAD